MTISFEDFSAMFDDQRVTSCHPTSRHLCPLIGWIPINPISNIHIYIICIYIYEKTHNIIVNVYIYTHIIYIIVHIYIYIINIIYVNYIIPIYIPFKPLTVDHGQRRTATWHLLQSTSDQTPWTSSCPPAFWGCQRNSSTKSWWSYGHLPVITGYFYIWDYTFYKWGYKYL